MLKGIPKILNGDVLKALCDMGHGDLLAIVDANYPAATMGKQVIEMPGVDATQFLEAIINIFPIDHICATPILLMSVEKEDIIAGVEEPKIFNEFKTIILNAIDNQINIGQYTRKEFYEISKKAYVIIHTGESRLYGNLLIYKGVIK